MELFFTNNHDRGVYIINMKGTVFQPAGICSCQVYCGVCDVRHDPPPTLSISTSVTLRYIRGSRWPNGLGICLVRRRSWVRSPHWHIPLLFLSGYLLCGSRFMLSKFNCDTLGWKTLPFILINILS